MSSSEICTHCRISRAEEDVVEVLTSASLLADLAAVDALILAHSALSAARQCRLLAVDVSC